MHMILVSSGCYNKISNDDNVKIIEALKSSPDGVEVCLFKKEELLDYIPRGELIGALSSRYNTLHAPIIDSNRDNIIYDNEPECIERIKSVYKIFRCNNIVFHLNNIIDNKMVKKELEGLNVSIENPDKRSAAPDYFSRIKEFTNAGYGLTIDVTHAAENNDLEELINEFRNDIVEIHWSRVCNNERHCSPFLGLKDNNEIEVIRNYELVRSLGKPIIIELNHTNNIIDTIRDDVKLLRSFNTVFGNLNIEYYNKWIEKICNNYDSERMNKHLIKHLGEERSSEWFASTENLLEMAYKVKGANTELVKKYESILEGHDNISIKDKIVRLLVHYIKYSEATSFP